MKRAVFVFIMIVIQSTFVEVASAGKDWREVTVRSLYFPPMVIDTENGAVIDKVKAVFECAQLTPVLSVEPWKRAFQETKSAHGALTPTFYTEERSQFFWYPDKPIHTLDFRLFARSERNISWNGGAESLEALSIGMVRGTLLENVLYSLNEDQKFHIVDVAEYSQLIQMLEANRIDLGTIERETFLPLAAGVNYEGTVTEIDGPPLLRQPAYIVFNADELTQDEKDRINACHH